MPHASEHSHAQDFTGRTIRNFGGNLRFSPRYCYAPATESEILAILDRHAQGKIRVVGSLHSWSPLVVTEDVLLSLENFRDVQIDRDPDGAVWATIAAGCKVKHALNRLRSLANVTLPAIGLITEQTIGGVIATATHGSGRHSFSHYIEEARVAAFDAKTGQARIFVWNAGDSLRAVRCALGCMGVVLSVRIRCVPDYDIAETIVRCDDLDEALTSESRFPLQQFYLVPHLWKYFVQRREALPPPKRARTLIAGLYRIWWFLFIDVGLHLAIKTLLLLRNNPRWIRIFFRDLLPRMIPCNLTIIDRADRMLVMEHELFRHLEIEIYVPASRVKAAGQFVIDVLRVFDGSRPTLPPESAEPLKRIGLFDEVRSGLNTYSHHYPVTFRRVLRDEAMLAPSAGLESAWYAISFITYNSSREPFVKLATILGRAMAELFDARLHWGKYFPWGEREINNAYPERSAFCRACEAVDPNGVFRNDFVTSRLFNSKDTEVHREPVSSSRTLLESNGEKEIAEEFRTGLRNEKRKQEMPTKPVDARPAGT